MTDEQLQQLMEILDKEDNRTVCHVVKFLLFTGARLSEALHAQWADIDRERRTRQIQATNSKSKRRRAVPPNDSALQLLNQLGTEGKSLWLFINRKRKGARLTTINKVWHRLRVDAGLPRLRLHDLRHMYASMLVNTGSTLYQVQQILGHSDPSVTQRYAHLSMQALQGAANSVGRYLDNAVDKAEQ